MSKERIVGGIDEVGWGALAGPIISVVALFRDADLAFLPPGVTDSKRITEAKRKSLFLPIIAAAVDIGIGHAWPWEIDNHKNPRDALQLSYIRAIDDLTITKPDILIVDGDERVRAWAGPQRVEPKADLNHKQVSAASIVAKVFRDRIMEEYHKVHPRYDWASNKGYGTPPHLEAIRQYGILNDGTNLSRYLHRRSFCTKHIVEPPARAGFQRNSMRRM